jgi:hypothetical protein
MTNKNRMTSITISDLEAIHALEQLQVLTTKYREHEEIFEEICQDVEAEDELIMEASLSSSIIRTRRTSIGSGPTYTMEPLEHVDTCKKHRYPRRHSTYNARHRKFHRDAHATIKDYLLTIQDENHARRANFVTNLMDFNLSFEVAMAASSSSDEMMSPALNLSCPILSYLKEDDEDSIELIMIKKPSLIPNKDDSNPCENWESLKDDGESEQFMDDPSQTNEYIVRLPPLNDDEEESSRQRGRKKLHSYQMLEQRLSSESHMSVVKSFGFHGKMAAIGYPTTTTTSMPTTLKFSSSHQRQRLYTEGNTTKEYGEDEETQGVSNAYRSTTNQPVTTKQPCARGA